MRQALRGLSVIALLLALQACGPGVAPQGQPPMVQMTTEALETLRGQFNATPDIPRVILLLSPT
jgi:hypothetical protein